MENKIFQEAHIGPLTLRNRTIRSAAFESMCPGHEPSQMLYDYHTSVARGGVGMTTVAYAAVEEPAANRIIFSYYITPFPCYFKQKTCKNNGF